MPILLILLALLLPHSLLRAEDFTIDPATGIAIPKFMGEIKLLSGTAYHTTKGRKRDAVLGTKVNQTDVIETESNGFVRVILADDTILNIGPGSKISFDQFELKNKSEREFEFKLHKGQLRSQIKNKAPEGKLRIKTPIATMGVRGTELLINHRTLLTREISELALMSGEASVQALAREAGLTKGERIIIAIDTENQNQGEKRNSLEESEWKLLMNDRALMPLFDVSQLESSDPLYPIFNSRSPSQASETGEKESKDITRKTKPKAPSTNDNLKKLNEMLREEYLKKQ